MAANSGVLQATLAYAMWGLLPLYFHALAPVPPLDVVLHRALWSLVFLLMLLAVLRRWEWLRTSVRQPATLATVALSALVLSANWLVYVWAISHERVVEASLGYFVTPLITFLLGFFFLHERPRRLQWCALAMAGAGVLWLTLFARSPPWVGLVLAVSFAVYGWMRKTAPLGALEGLTLETMLLAPLAACLVAWRAWHGASEVVAGPSLAMLALSGPFTALPMLLFAGAARRISLTTLGLLQYISPSIQFALGVWMLHEPLGERLTGFILIWLALAMYSAESWLSMRRARAGLVLPRSERPFVKSRSG